LECASPLALFKTVFCNHDWWGDVADHRMNPACPGLPATGRTPAERWTGTDPERGFLLVSFSRKQYQQWNSIICNTGSGRERICLANPKSAAV
jgi:hypothetical protein